MQLSGQLWSGEPVMSSGSTLEAYLQDRHGQTLRDIREQGALFRSASFRVASRTVGMELKSAIPSLSPESGIASFWALDVLGVVGSNVTLQFTTTVNEGDRGVQAYEHTVPLCLAQCRLESRPPAGNIGECITCPSGQYSIVPSATVCLGCEPGAVCYGGAQIEALPAYWNKPGPLSSLLTIPLCFSTHTAHTMHILILSHSTVAP